MTAKLPKWIERYNTFKDAEVYEALSIAWAALDYYAKKPYGFTASKTMRKIRRLGR